jgi:hypothetical protein
MAFDVHCKRPQCLYKVLSSFERGLSTDQSKHVVVGYDQAKVAATARKELAVPRTKVFHVCFKSWPTKVVDEFRTTIGCHDYEERLMRVHKEDGRQNRGLLHCQNACRSVPLKNRALNAGKNIALVTQTVYCYNEERPVFLSRS